MKNRITISREFSNAASESYVHIMTPAEYDAIYGVEVDSAYIVRAHGDGYLETDDAVEALHYAAECADPSNTDLRESLADARKEVERLEAAVDEGDEEAEYRLDGVRGEARHLDWLIDSLEDFRDECLRDAALVANDL